MNGAAYIRVSTDDQLEYSPDSQQRKIFEYASQHDIQVAENHIYTDEGISGRSARNRPAFLRMIADARKKPAPFQVILVWKFSRFARSRQDSIFYKSMLRRECQVEVISVSEPLSDDPTSILIEALLEAMDEYYSLNLAGEVRRGMQEKFSRGQTVSIPPFGYRMGKESFVPDPETAPYVRELFAKYAEGQSLRAIASWLNASGIRTIRGNLFESRSVEYILSNPVYTGMLRMRKHSHSGGSSGFADRYYQDQEVAIVKGLHPPLITQQLFDLVQSRLTLIRGKNTSKRCSPFSLGACSSSEVFSPLAGLIRCSACGGSLFRTAHGTALQCGSYAKGKCRVSHYVSLKLLAPAVSLLLNPCPFALSGSGTASPALLHPAEPDSTSASPAALIRKERQKLDRIQKAYEEGIDSLQEYQKQKQAILLRIESLQIRAAEKAEGRISSRFTFSWHLTGLIDFMQSGLMTSSDQNELMTVIFSRVIFSRLDGSLQPVYRS